jgi:hypothetical protein
MPTLDKWYKDEALTRKWVENPNFPPYDEYKSAVVDYAQSPAARPAAWFYTNYTTDFNTLLGSILGDVWTGKTTAKDAISKNLEAFEGGSYRQSIIGQGDNRRYSGSGGYPPNHEVGSKVWKRLR